jgi:hypothetical protein
LTTRLREFLYVDVDRVRSLLAQLEGGVVENIRAEGVNTAQAEVQARLFGIGGRGGYAHESRTEESRSLQDLTFVAFEEAADDAGLIFDLDSSFQDPERWRSGEVHARLRDGLLIRVTCPVQILDGELFRLRVERFDKMADAIVAVTDETDAPQAGAGGSTRSRREASDRARRSVREHAKRLLLGGSDPSQLMAIVSFVESFVGDSVAIRIAPCGIDQLELGFGGALLGRDEYIQREREHLFSRYGARASNWTAVCQIAAIPSRDTKVEMASDNGNRVTDDTGQVNRANMERVAGEILEVMEGIGIVEGPRWPSISVTPLGLYRTMPTGSSSD